MKVRYYRGPFDGKINHVRDDMTVITTSIYNREHPPIWSNSPIVLSLSPSKYNYRRTRHTHPDGSVYFEWDRPKGTKF